MGAYYNEIDPDAAHILRALIADGVIAPGDVDTRSIAEVQPNDLLPYAQVHLFAGGGLWSVAARMAGWPDDLPLWSASCPCQPFSQAGKGTGTDDPRHLWPNVHRLYRARRPAPLVGEQVAGKAGRAWFDGVRASLEEIGVVCRAVDIPACAVDAPHERNRLYWVALADAEGEQRGAGLREVDTFGNGPFAANDDGALGYAGGVGRSQALGEPAYSAASHWEGATDRPQRLHGSHRRNGSFWADADWTICHDQKARRTQPGSPLLVDGFPGRLGLWRVAGNAISPVLAAEVIGALKDTLDERRAA